MGRSGVLRVDVLPLKHLIVGGAVATILWAIIMILAGTAPDNFVHSHYDAYVCNNHTSVYNPAICTGYNPASGQWSPWYEVTTGALNKGFYFSMTPHTHIPFGVRREVTMRVDLQGRANGSNWQSLLRNETVTSEFECYESSTECVSFLLLFEDITQFNDYRTRVEIITNVTDFLGNIKYQVSVYNDAFQKEHLGFRMAFLIISALVTIASIILLRRSGSLDQWEWETKLMVILLLGLILYNDPFYPFKFFVSGWFFVFLIALLELLFMCAVFSFWLNYLARLKELDGDEKPTSWWIRAPKFGLLGIYFVLTFILYMMSSIRDRLTPLFGLTTHATPVQVIYYLSAALYMGIILWLAVTIVLTIPVAFANKHILVRFLFFSIPSAVCVISLLVGVFRAEMGPFGASKFGSIYFMGLWNLYVYFLLWGHWPTTGGFTAHKVSESTPIFSTPDDKPRV